MAVLALTSLQFVPGTRRYPFDHSGKLRFTYFKIDATITTAAFDIGSTILIGDMPNGRIRILPNLCRHWFSAWGAGRTLSYGHGAYTGTDLSAVAANAVAFSAAIDVSAALTAQVWSTAITKFDIMSASGWQMLGNVAGANGQIGSTLEGWAAYLRE